MKIFREEVLKYQSHNEYGKILIPPSFLLSLTAILALLLFIFVLLFFYYGNYTRKAHLSGIVMPSSGLVKITPLYAGYVTKLILSEGEHVKKGAPLYHISGEHYDGHGVGILASASLSLRLQLAMLSSQKSQEQYDNNQQQQAYHSRILSLHPQIKSAEQRLVLAEQQVTLATAVMGRYKKLNITHYVSDVEYQQKQIEVSTAKQNAEDQRQAVLQMNSMLETTENELKHLRAQGESRLSELDRQLQGIKQQLDEVNSQANFTLSSPVSGTVAAILIRQGQSVKAGEPVMTLVPDNAHLQIELYATSQKAGFIQPGQRVALRFDAFPYQKFGVQYGSIRDISRTTLTPMDLLSVSPITWKENEGHYRIIVEPEKAFIQAYGKKEPLRPGMTLEGDVSLDNRHLWEWFTEPLWSLKGKL
ncbi:TPA: HlyD family efflux transporter periplasmic adaptor subunit [Klebsiella michiganensis]|uniref:HlyD family secretion protein n=1 Tax=Klebsiella michiganensis TaxID=1134687 RepID=UPI00254ED71C|nr:efflux RND transporter periplasmic adaptor subunit [Klebsiella michiganensis]MDK9837401.1 HlyD family secretion protein [Klebsiella michiganensis]HDX8940398.1 HlyD family efflux transporter periplasmic adaptor subunit [Klebsiella michiganensis]